MRAAMLGYIGLAIGLGTLLTIQAGVNSRLRLRAGDPIHAAVISSGVALCSLLAYALLQRHPLPEAGRLTSAPWWVWTGGLMGAAYVALTLTLVTRLGSAVLFALIVVGQLLAALLIDHYGLLGVPRHEISPPRAIGALLLVAGVVLIRRF